jgi:cytochrome c
MQLKPATAAIRKGIDMIWQPLDDAKILVSKAVSYYKMHGKEKSLAEFSNPKGLYREDEIYIFVMTLDGLVIAHGADDMLIGRDLKEISDGNGIRYFQEIVEIANSVGSGVVEYWWMNPSTKHRESKNVYFEKVDDIIICSGVYQ